MRKEADSVVTLLKFTAHADILSTDADEFLMLLVMARHKHIMTTTNIIHHYNPPTTVLTSSLIYTEYMIIGVTIAATCCT